MFVAFFIYSPNKVSLCSFDAELALVVDKTDNIVKDWGGVGLSKASAIFSCNKLMVPNIEQDNAFNDLDIFFPLLV